MKRLPSICQWCPFFFSDANSIDCNIESMSEKWDRWDDDNKWIPYYERPVPRECKFAMEQAVLTQKDVP